ncbi:hypothetical protein R1flu_028836 [Riccia fluitans]|uniref:Uncharacterized protein n=1 Tax=Riccia fluitans TaxID=41844 RepID=A0ABD1XNH0_9MARC
MIQFSSFVELESRQGQPSSVKLERERAASTPEFQTFVRSPVLYAAAGVFSRWSFTCTLLVWEHDRRVAGIVSESNLQTDRRDSERGQG